MSLGRKLVVPGGGGGGPGGATFSGGISTGGNTLGTTGLVSAQLVLVGGNQITLSGSTNGGSATVTISGANALTNINVSAGTTSNNLTAVVFSNSNGVSFGLNGSTVTATITVPAQTNQTGGIYITAQSTGQSSSSTYDLRTLSMVGDGIVSIGWSNSTLRVSATQSNQALSAANGSFAFQTASFSNVNGISFGTSAGSAITASHNAITSQSNQQLTMFATGNTTLSSTGTSNASSLIFRGSGAASVGITNGSVLIDVAAGAAAITQSIGISTQTAGGATAGTSGYATGDDILYHFVPGSNITMSQSLNGASATLSIYGPAAGGGATISSYQNATFFNSSFQAVGGSISFAQAFLLPVAGSFAFLRFLGSVSMFSTTIATLASATASAQAGQTTTANLVVYTAGSGASSESLFSVASGSTAWNASQRISITNSTVYSQSWGFTGNVETGSFTFSTSTQRSTSNYSFSTGWGTNFSGARAIDTPFANSLPADDYILIYGFSSSSSSAGAGLGGMSAGRGPAPFGGLYGLTISNVSFGLMNSTNNTSGGIVGVGSFSTAGGGTTANFPKSAISSIGSNQNVVFRLLRSA